MSCLASVWHLINMFHKFVCIYAWSNDWNVPDKLEIKVWLEYFFRKYAIFFLPVGLSFLNFFGRHSFIITWFHTLIVLNFPSQSWFKQGWFKQASTCNCSGYSLVIVIKSKFLEWVDIQRWDIQPPRGVLRKSVLKICRKFTGEHPCRSVI